MERAEDEEWGDEEDEEDEEVVVRNDLCPLRNISLLASDAVMTSCVRWFFLGVRYSATLR